MQSLSKINLLVHLLVMKCVDLLPSIYLFNCNIHLIDIWMVTCGNCLIDKIIWVENVIPADQLVVQNKFHGHIVCKMYTSSLHGSFSSS